MKLKNYINERPHPLKTYGKEMSVLDDAFEALSKIKDVDDPILRKRINSIRVNIKYLIAKLREIE